MECPNCQADISDSAKFCGKCGTKISRICKSCGFENPPGNNFCEDCGHGLVDTEPAPAPKELSFDEKLDKIQRYLPKALTEKILSQRDKIEGERKQVTVMFCDMEGFTPLVEQIGAEEAYDIMDKVYEFLIHKVHDYEGTVNEMTGDGIMALFGAPVALEDAPQRAIRSAYAIHREMARFTDKLRQEGKHIPPLKMRIGIHSGPVVVGTLGNDLRVEFKAVGDTVNLASRTEGIAEPGSTYVTDDTFKLTEGFFRFEALGEREVKGRKDPVRVYRVIAPSSRRTRFDVSAERGLTPFVGRDRELELLLDGVERTKEGAGQAFSIVGQAGVGKSRFLYEFRKCISNEDITFLEGKCLSYSKGVPFHPIIDVLRGNFNISEDDTDDGIRNKVQSSLEVLWAKEKRILPYLLELLRVKDSGIDRLSMSPEGLKERIVEAVKQIILKGAQIRPLVIAIEDLHWADKSTEDALKWLLESIPAAKVLIIFTYRPEFVHTWGGRSYHNQITLNRLSNRESVLMISNLLGTETEAIDPDLQRLVLGKTEGVPFFIEEFVRSLYEIKVIEERGNTYHLKENLRGVTIPSTIQDVIVSRVDSLPEGAKEVLQIGSVIEREFSHDMIREVTGLPEKELLSYLSILKGSELLYERGVYPENTYIFRHALAREVICNSLLTKKKERIHKKIGNTIEIKYRDNLSEYYELLAEHFIGSEDYEKAEEYSQLAARKALKTGSYNDAIALTRKRLACLENLPRSEVVQRKIIDVRTIIGMYCIQLNYHEEAKREIESIVDLALKLDCKKQLPKIYIILGTHDAVVNNDFPSAFEHLEKALEISNEHGDVVSSSQANYWLGVVLAYDCQFEKAHEHFEQNLKILETVNYIWGFAATKAVISLHLYGFAGNVDFCYNASKEAMEISGEGDDVWVNAITFSARGVASLWKGYLDEALTNLLEGISCCERINYFSWNSISHDTLGCLFYELGDYEKSENYFIKATALAEKMDSGRSWLNLLKIGAEKARSMQTEVEIDLEKFETISREHKMNANAGRLRRDIAQILLNAPGSKENDVEDWINAAIDTDLKNRTLLSLGLDYVLYAELLKRKSDTHRAKEKLVKAIDILRECGADGWVERYEKELAELS